MVVQLMVKLHGWSKKGTCRQLDWNRTVSDGSESARHEYEPFCLQHFAYCQVNPHQHAQWPHQLSQ